MTTPPLDLYNAVWQWVSKDREYADLREHLRTARAFSLDDEATRLAATLAYGPDRAARAALHLELSRLPFKSMWIELDNRLLRKAMWAAAGQPFREDPEESDHRMGFLLHELPISRDTGVFRALTFSKHNDMALPEIWPLVNVASPEGSMGMINSKHYSGDLAELAETIERLNAAGAIPAQMWGGFSKVEEYRASPLWRRNGIDFDSRFSKKIIELSRDKDAGQRLVDAINLSVEEQVGDLSLIVAMLALINHVPVSFAPSKPPGRFIASGKTRPFLESNIVHIDVPARRRRVDKWAEKILKRARVEQRRRRHEVRGHWRTCDVQPNDRWEGFTDPWTMTKRFRVWIAPHERGDASLGYVSHTYAVEGHRP